MSIKDHKKNDMFKKVVQKLFQTLYASLEKLSKAHEGSKSSDGRIQFDKEIANGISDFCKCSFLDSCFNFEIWLFSKRALNNS